MQKKKREGAGGPSPNYIIYTSTWTTLLTKKNMDNSFVGMKLAQANGFQLVVFESDSLSQLFGWLNEEGCSSIHPLVKLVDDIQQLFVSVPAFALPSVRVYVSRGGPPSCLICVVFCWGLCPWLSPNKKKKHGQL